MFKREVFLSTNPSLSPINQCWDLAKSLSNRNQRSSSLPILPYLPSISIGTWASHCSKESRGLPLYQSFLSPINQCWDLAKSLSNRNQRSSSLPILPYLPSISIGTWASHCSKESRGLPLYQSFLSPINQCWDLAKSLSNRKQRSSSLPIPPYLPSISIGTWASHCSKESRGLPLYQSFLSPINQCWDLAKSLSNRNQRSSSLPILPYLPSISIGTWASHCSIESRGLPGGGGYSTFILV